MTSSNLLACTTGRSAGLAPLRSIGADLTPRVRQAGSIAHQPADFGKLTSRICSRDRVTRRQEDQWGTPAGEKGVAADEEGVGPLAHKSCESRIDLAAVAGVEDLDLQPNGASSRSQAARRGGSTARP